MMKIHKTYNLLFVLIVATLFGCQENEFEFGEIVPPTNLIIDIEIVGADDANPNGDGSGVVNFTAKADNAVSYTYYLEGSGTTAPSGEATFNFTNVGTFTYELNVVATGTGGVSSSKIIQVEVLSSYDAPDDLKTLLFGYDPMDLDPNAETSKVWRVKSAIPAHFGLGPVGGFIPAEWYGAAPGEKSATGMYDDLYIFKSDGTFTHITNSVNDDPTEDTSGTIFGRDPYIFNDLGASGAPVNGADVENYEFNDYSERWSLSAPGGAETISLTGNAFIGYYTGGNHTYQIFSRDTPNELILRTTDENSEFDWWFVITSEEPVDNTLNSAFTNLVWEDDFNTDGAPDATKWTYDLGTGDNGWGNGELQSYTNSTDNAIVENGVLKIKAKADGASYTSARLKSQGLYEFTYGRVEVRAKLPASQGTWPAIWMLGANFNTVGWPVSGEIDIMEQKGQDKNTVLSTIHYPGNFAGGGPSSSTELTTSTTQFHNYTVEWSATEINFAIDDQIYHRLSNDSTLPFNADFFLILNVAMGGTLGGTIDPGFTEDMMEIDYVKVYQ